MHLFKNCQIQFLILYELIVWACFIWVNKLHRAVDRWWDRGSGLVVTARETWFTQHNTSRLLFQAAGRQPLLHTCLAWFMEKLGWIKNKKTTKKTRYNFATLLQFVHHCKWLQRSRNRCQVMFSQLESVESVMRKCMNVNVIASCNHVV